MLVNTERLRSKMDEDGLDGIVGTTPANVHYFAGFWSLPLSIFPYEGQTYTVVTRDALDEPFVVASTAEIDQVLDSFANIKGTVNFGTFFREGPYGDLQLTEDEQRLKAMSVDCKPASGPLEALATALEQMGLADKKIGIDEFGLRNGFLEILNEMLPKAEFRNASTLLRWVRKVKTPEEIQRLREVVRITERAMLAATGIAREGITEYELAREFERSIVSQGGSPRFTLIRIGRNAIAGQRTQDRTPLHKGDLIWFDTGALYRGYWSDIARIFSLGEPGERTRRIYAALLEGEKIGIAETRVGMTGSELFDITIKACRAAGHPEYRRHHVGHGIGSEVYEPPLLTPVSDDVIEEGSVINIETPYYEFGLGALHIEDPYVVRGDGNHELLTTLEREMQVLPLQ